MEWQIKHFDELDSLELYKIIKQRINVFVVEQNCPYPDCDDKDLNSYHLFSEDDDLIVAYCRILLPGVSYKEPSIGRVLVHKEYRRQGLGKELMKKAIEYIEEELGKNRIRISAQQYLLKFYTGLGFKVVSDMYLEDNIPHLEMLYERNLVSK